MLASGMTEHFATFINNRRQASVPFSGSDSHADRVQECLLVVNLAIVVYHALDYTHGEDEERLMSPDLENLITEMTANNVAGLRMLAVLIENRRKSWNKAVKWRERGASRKK
ncbi:jg3128 [Pararge aegeria aegeria]|uniref:Jg3128 protein n=1 Tax=Pararge aegeria aegeria TaxID=348720 RepID=A0A8S4QYH2_9NEOP|nr:jg3128 [Pararge aegeria aegeria]